MKEKDLFFNAKLERYPQPNQTWNLLSTDVFKLIINSSSLEKVNNDLKGVWISDLNLHRFLRFYFSVFNLVLVSTEKICQTLGTVFDHISKYLEFLQKYSAARRIFNSPLCVWKCGQIRSFVLNILHETCLSKNTFSTQKTSVFSEHGTLSTENEIFQAKIPFQLNRDPF